MTASQATRIDAEVTRLAEITDKLASVLIRMDYIFELGRQEGLRGMSPPRGTPGKRAANSHLRLVR